VTDGATPEQLADSIRALEELPITYKLGGHDMADFLGADLLVINPAVDRAKSEFVQAALKKGVSATTEMNLFLERCAGRTIGITGSVGKSTTTALIFEALKAALGIEGAPHVFVGGNIGRSLLLDLPAIRPQDFVVLELSSFMLDHTPEITWSPHMAVVTNIYPNHLDRHGTMAAYTAAKQNILRFQKPDDVAVLNADHELVSRWVHLARGKVVKFTTRGPASKRLDLLMPGEHNQSNAAAALAVLDAIEPDGGAKLSLNRAAAIDAMKRFPGLPHRLQCVHTWQPVATDPRQVRFYNDSKATTPDASITAIQAFPPRSAIFIVGGYDKHIDMSTFIEMIAARAAGVVGIGQTGKALIDAIQLEASAQNLSATYVGTLDAAVAQCKLWAAQSTAATSIVLSPACASWDQFANYEERGELFSKISRGT